MNLSSPLPSTVNCHPPRMITLSGMTQIILGVGDGPRINVEPVKGHLEKPDILKSTGPDGLHPRVLKEPADIIASSAGRDI